MKMLVAMCIALLPLAAAAQDKPCGKAEMARADKAVDRVGTWPQMTRAWQDFRHCDSGAVAGLYTDAFVRLLVDWKDVPGAAAANQDAAFHAFMVKHLQDPAAKDDLETIYSRAKASCPAGQEAFCAQLIDLVKASGK